MSSPMTSFYAVNSFESDNVREFNKHQNMVCVEKMASKSVCVKMPEPKRSLPIFFKYLASIN